MEKRATAPVTDLESATQAIGQELIARAKEAERKRPLWDSVVGKLLDSARKDPKTMRALFRFIAAYPQNQKDPRKVAESLRKNFKDTPLLSLFGLGSALAGRLGIIDAALARSVRETMLRVARQFIAAESLEEVSTILDRIEGEGRFYTLDQQGEDVQSDGEAHAYYEKLIRKIQMVGERGRGEPNISLKVSGLASVVRFNALILEETDVALAVREQVKDRLRGIYREAMKHGVSVMIDAERYDQRELIAGIFQDVAIEEEFRQYDKLGIVVQAYLKDVETHVRELIDFARERGTPIAVRLVKGAYYDLEGLWAEQSHWESPVWNYKEESDIAFEDAAERIMQNEKYFSAIAVGTHFARSMARAIALAKKYGVESKFEIQMLYGMGNPFRPALVEMEIKERDYIPFGELITSLAYMIRRMQESTAKGSALLEMSVKGLDANELLRDPRVKLQERRVLASVRGEDSRRDDSRASSFQNVPRLDFSKALVRAKFARALEEVRGQLGRRVPIIIGDRSIIDREVYTRVNPARISDVVAEVALATTEDAELAISTARRAQTGWEKLGHHRRGDILLRAAEIFEERRNLVAAWLVFEGGKTWREAEADVAEAIDFCKMYGLAAHDLAERNPLAPFRQPGEAVRMDYVPRGVVAVISPWNFVALGTGMKAAALVTGNAVVDKPSRQLSRSHHAVNEIFYEAGVPRDVLIQLTGSGSAIGNVLASHPKVSMVTFTGSWDVGSGLAALTGKHFKKFMGEMGGKGAVLVLDDADPDMAIHAALVSAFSHAGQKCSAGSRLIVTEGIAPEILPRLRYAAADIIVADPSDPGVFYGPVIDEKAFRDIQNYMSIGRSEGEVLVEGGPAQEGGYFLRPAVYSNVTPSARIAQEEIFGPVLSVILAKDTDHAVEIANGTPYGLTLGVYTQDILLRRTLGRRLRAGQVYVNRVGGITGALVGAHSFGAIGGTRSGTGEADKTGSPGHLLAYVTGRTIVDGLVMAGHIEDDLS